MKIRRFFGLRSLHVGSLALGLAFTGCSGESSSPDGEIPDQNRESPPGGDSVEVEVPTATQEHFLALQARVEQAIALDKNGALAAHPATFTEDLGYDPLTSANLELIQSSSAALSANEQAALATHGFVISKDQEFGTFLRGYAQLYMDHLPVYITADAILEALHRSYDTMLLQMERALLIGEVRTLLETMRANLPSATASAEAKQHADLYLTVALGLLEGTARAPVAGADNTQIAQLVEKIQVASGVEPLQLFGVPRTVDFSQFTPRGHYTGESDLEQYFRAMMWLGRIDFRLLETQSDGSIVFHRGQYEATLLLHQLMTADAREAWGHVDLALRTFVGESDYMVVPEVEQLVADLGGVDAALAADNETVTTAIAQGGYGEQQIASHFMVNDGTVKTLPLNRSFLIFGQRYIVDSHVFSETVYDRIAARMMPSPLDAAFAAFGNNQALRLLEPELDKYPELPGALSRLRVLVDDHDETFWDANFYNLWLGSLRALSPSSDSTPAANGLPSVTGTEAWGRRLLNTQLGSWAELRHDTLLYAKQSYTSVPGCEFPDAYVDPYPEFYAQIRKYAEAGTRLIDIAQLSNSQFLIESMTAYFTNLERVARHLQTMAENQRQGIPFTEEQMAFVNDAVRVEEDTAGCATIEIPDGWYADLFFLREHSIEFDPTIADVHTQPADEAGNIVGRILHVGTSFPRLMVTTVDSCTGPRAYAGVVFAYHETVTEDFDRLTDERWAEHLQSNEPRPPDVSWLGPVLAE